MKFPLTPNFTQLILSALLFANAASAQDTAGRPGTQAHGSVGHFYGRILDPKTGKGADGASVQLAMIVFDANLRHDRDSTVGGEIARKGNFSFENLPVGGRYRLVVSAVGFKPFEQELSFDAKPGGNSPDQLAAAFDRDLGNIKLVADASVLAGVTVTAQKPLVQLGIDRKVYNVEKDIAAQGGTAVDIMKNVPSLAVDIDGNVTLRNSTPTIFVDGRPTTLSLDQIPSDAIASVEVITNPGAKFDASGGTSGILNIVLKKNRRAGYNGNLRAGVDKRGGYNAGGDFNMKQGKLNFFANANYNYRKSVSPGTTDRTSLQSNPNTALHQVDDNINRNSFAFGRVGLDYLADNRNTLSFAGSVVHGHFTPTTGSDLYIDTIGAGQSYTRRDAANHGQFTNTSGMASFKHTFPRAGEEWTADVNYSRGTNANHNDVNSTIFPQPSAPEYYRQRQDGGGTNEYVTAQTDFTNPFSEKSKLEAGARAAFRNISSLNDIGVIDASGALVPLPLLSSNFGYHDRVLAAYATYSNAIGRFGYQLGLRAENSHYDGVSTYAVKNAQNGSVGDTVGSFSNDYPVSLFPSVFLSQKLGQGQELQLNYTRRIDRPNFFQLFPYTDYSDSLNLSRGNPNLKPQFTNSLELSYEKTYGKNMFLASAYFKYTTDLITRYQSLEKNPITDSTVIINTFVNARSSYVSGLELIGRNAVASWWDITSNLNFFTAHINTADSLQTPGTGISWFGKINNTFKVVKGLTLQVTGDYTSRSVLPPGGTSGQGGGWGPVVSGNAQGFRKPTGGVDASVRYEFLKNRAASFTLSMSDIFRTRVYDVVTESDFFTQEVVRRRDPQMVRLQFNYRFGKFDVALFKRKNNKDEGEKDPGGGQGAIN